MTQAIKLVPLSEQSLDAQLRRHTGDGFGSSFYNEGSPNTLFPKGILVHRQTKQRFIVPLPQFSSEEFSRMAHTSIWMTERYDLECWPKVRDEYIGKRTLLSNENGKTVLLIEGKHFLITDPFQEIKHHV